MMTPENIALLQELGKLNHGKALKALLREHLDNMNDLTTCETWEEAQGRKHAIAVIKDIQSKLEERPERVDRRPTYV